MGDSLSYLDNLLVLSTSHLLFLFVTIREVKHDVYAKWQTAKMKRLPSLLVCVYSRGKLFVFAMNSRRRYSIFCVYLRIRREEL